MCRVIAVSNQKGGVGKTVSFLKKKEPKEMLDAMEFAQCTPSYQQTLSGWISQNCAKRVCWRKGY